MYKVLLVDDEILVREAISENINWGGLGFDLVKVCENGKEAMEYLKEYRVDLVLTDIYMPYMDGMELSKYVYENHPRTKIVIFSGYSEFEYAKQAIKYKVAEYILKPVTARELSEVLSGIYEKLEAEQQEQQKINQLSDGYRTYAKNKTVIVSKAMSELVKGTRDINQCLDELEELGIVIQGGYYRAAVLDIDIYSDFYEEKEAKKKESALMAFAVENISSEIVAGHECGFVYKDDNNRVCILYFTHKPREFRQKAAAICQEIRSKVLEIMNLRTSVAIGTTVSCLEDLHLSYESAMEILGCRYVKGGDILLDCEEESPGEIKTTVDIKESLKNLGRAIKVKDAQQMDAVLRLIQDKMVASYIHKDKGVAYVHQILMTVSETLGSVGVDMKLEDHVITAVSKAGNLNKAMDIVREYAARALDIMREFSQNSGQYQTALAVDYLRENYGNPSLSLNDICAYLNISTSHFSNIFKDTTGETFTETLTRIRMEKAKQLLTETSLKNYEIADKVGISDPHYFSVTFKKATGMTPKEFARRKGR